MKLVLLLFAVTCLAFAQEEEVLTSDCPEGQGLDYMAPNCHPCFEGWYDSFESDNCIMCPDGLTHNMRGATDQSMCTMCDKGWMIDSEVPGNCTICPKGTYSLEPDSTSCTSCPEGQTTNKAGASTASFCHSCKVGQRFSESKGMCIDCNKNYYGNGKDGRCTPCPYGTLAPAGTKPATAADCSECYEGWGKDKYGRCKACAPGTYGPGDSMCHDCPEGMFTPKYKYVACVKACVAGEGWSNYNRKCLPCRQGYYSPDGKTEGCVWCPDGTSTKGTGATSLDQCSEPACLSSGQGWSVSLSKCVACEKGTYSSSGKVPGCTPCPPGKTTRGTGSKDFWSCS